MVSYISKRASVVGALSLAFSAFADQGPPSRSEHQVGIGDTIESIARKYTGHEKHTDIIRQLNPHLKEVGLQIGDYLFVPEEPVAKEQNGEGGVAERLPPSPQKRNDEIRTIPGVKYGLAHVYRPGGFKIVSAPVDKE